VINVANAIPKIALIPQLSRIKCVHP
jgi:hypothetical protein